MDGLCAVPDQIRFAPWVTLKCRRQRYSFAVGAKRKNLARFDRNAQSSVRASRGTARTIPMPDT